MANRRMIYQDFFEDDYFGGVDHTARLLWIGKMLEFRSEGKAHRAKIIADKRQGKSEYTIEGKK